MTTALITHADCLRHLNPPGHPERAERLRAIEAALEAEEFAYLVRAEAPVVEDAAILRAHPDTYLERLRATSDEWWEEQARFFDVQRSRAWVMLRRLNHTSHHRGQQMAMLRMLGRELHSNYGPTADTGGLMQNHAPTIYAYADVDALLEAEGRGGAKAPLPGAAGIVVSERPQSPHRTRPATRDGWYDRRACRSSRSTMSSCYCAKSLTRYAACSSASHQRPRQLELNATRDLGMVSSVARGIRVPPRCDRPHRGASTRRRRTCKAARQQRRAGRR